MDILNLLGLILMFLLAVWKLWELLFGSHRVSGEEIKRSEVQRNLNKLLVAFYAEEIYKSEDGDTVPADAEQKLLHDFNLWLEKRKKKSNK